MLQLFCTDVLQIIGNKLDDRDLLNLLLLNKTINKRIDHVHFWNLRSVKAFPSYDCNKVDCKKRSKWIYRLLKDSLLLSASMYGELSVVKYLVEECGADVHEENDHALRGASQRGHLSVVKYLVEECGADVHEENDHALRLASWNGHHSVVKYLMEECGADVHAKNDFTLKYGGMVITSIQGI